ncbi:hypothetical protein Tco_1399593 [Tanacetum coccineum]
MDASRPCEHAPLGLDHHPSFLAIIGSSIFTVGSLSEHTDCKHGNLPRVIPLRSLGQSKARDDVFFAEMAHSTWNLKSIPLIEIYPLIFTKGKLGHDE